MSEEKYIPRLLTRYREQAVKGLLEEFSYANVMEVPRLQKIVLNISMK